MALDEELPGVGGEPQDLTLECFPFDARRGTVHITQLELFLRLWQRAHAGSDTMLIWLGKQMLKQTDRQELAIKNPDFDPETLSDAELSELAAELRRRAQDHYRDSAPEGLPDEPAGMVR